MTQPTTERDRIKERVAKLLNLTLDKGASENEAMMAAEKAAELMAFYDIEASELSIRSARATKQTVSARKYGKMIIAAPVAHHVAQLCDCMYWGSTEETGKHYTFFGLPADAQIAAYLFDLISNGIATEVAMYKASPDYLISTGTHGRTLVSSFIADMEDRICARVDALQEEKQSAIQKATGRSLVVIKAAQIVEDFKATGIRLVSSGITRSTGGGGYANGQTAGERVPLSSGVGARRSAGMLT
jgi:Protein of unknown function (DUF2786)